MFKVAGVDLNVLGEKPPIPELPTTETALGELSKKNIQVVYESDATSAFGGEYQPSGIAITSLVLRCPFCTMLFSGRRQEGCSGGSIEPYNCPNCSFPHNVLSAYLKLVHVGKNAEK